MADVVSFANSVGADLVAYAVQNLNDGAAAVAYQPGRCAVYNPGQSWFGVMAHASGGPNMGAAHHDGLLNPKTIMLHNYCGGGAAPPYYFTSPNIYWNGVRLVGDGNNCSQGGLINGGDNTWRIASGAQETADSFDRPVARPNLDRVVLRWLFTNAPAAVPAGTTNYDVVSSAPAVVRGNGATCLGDAIRLPGGTTGNAAADSIAAYIDMPNGMVSVRTHITIEVWANVRSAQNWGRFLDFGRTVQAGDGLGAPGEWTGTPGTPAPGTTSGSDELLLTSANGTDLGQQRFSAALNGAAVTVDSALASAATVRHHYTVSFADGDGVHGANGGRWRWYRDGEYITHLDVNWHLSQMEDVNNWRGRSLWSGDAMAHIYYHEVRISDATFSHQEALANYLLGPNYSGTTVTLTGHEPGGTSSFNAAGLWSNGTAPNATNTYETWSYRLRTPENAGKHTFGGALLKLSGGQLRWKGTASSTITISNLLLNSGEIHHAGSGTFTLADGVTVTNSSLVRAINGPISLAARLSGGAALTFLGNTVTLANNNATFIGKTFVGCGAPGALALTSETQLGANPPAFAAAHCTLNRGWLYTTANMDIDDPNRGVQIGVSGGIFNVAPGTTLALRTPLSSPALPGDIKAGLLIKENGGALVLAGTNNTYSGPIEMNAGTLTIAGTGLPSGGRTFVNGGTLVLNSSLGGRVTVRGGTFSAQGSVSSLVIVESGGTLSSCTNLGTLTCNGLTLDASSTLTMDLSGTNSDLISVNGDVALNGTLHLRASNLTNGACTLMTDTGARSGSSLTLGNVPAGYAFTLDYATPGRVRLVVVGGVVPVSLVATGAIWKYFDQTNDLGTAWRSIAFNDSAWSSGPSMLGCGDANGILPTTVVASNRQWTTYFRRAVFVPNASQVRSLNARILRDAAAVVYLNGAEVWRDENLPSTGTIQYNTPAQSALGGADESAWLPFSLNPALLQNGTNMIGVEVHQNAVTSSDLAMNFELSGTLLLPSNIRLSRDGSTLSWPHETGWFSLFTTTNLTPPIPWTRAASTAVFSSNLWDVALPAATNRQRYFRLQHP